jgi:glycosyltransferase involved in cell wall biosynthesis
MLKRLAWSLVVGALYLAVLPFVLQQRWTHSARRNAAGLRPRLFFGATSINTLPNLARALSAQGYDAPSGTVADVGFHIPDGFDKVVRRSASPHVVVRRVLGGVEAVAAFVWALRRADIFHLYLDGGFLRRTPLQLYELQLLKLARKHVIVFPYGHDSWALDRIPDPTLRAALLADYPGLAATSAAVGARLDRFCREADLVVGCLSHVMVLPRHDALMMTCYGVETDTLIPAYPDSSDQILRVFHAPNHRNFKGSDVLERAVRTLQADGVKIELDLVQKRPRAEVLERMAHAHVLVDQLHAGYGLTALEGMALGKIVITGRNWAAADAPFLDFAPYRACPVHWADPATIEQTLRDIARDRHLWRAWGESNRQFAERYHAPDAMARQWSMLYPLLGYVVSAAPTSRGPDSAAS